MGRWSCLFCREVALLRPWHPLTDYRLPRQWFFSTDRCPKAIWFLFATPLPKLSRQERRTCGFGFFALWLMSGNFWWHRPRLLGISQGRMSNTLCSKEILLFAGNLWFGVWLELFCRLVLALLGNRLYPQSSWKCVLFVNHTSEETFPIEQCFHLSQFRLEISTMDWQFLVLYWHSIICNLVLNSSLYMCVDCCEQFFIYQNQIGWTTL